MGSSLVRRTTASLVYRGSREIRSIERQTALALAYEDGEADVVDERIRNGFALALRAGERLTVLNRTNSELAVDNVELEMSLRVLERSVTFQAGDLITSYMRRSR